MLIEKIDAVALDPLQGCFRHLADVRRPAIETRLLAVLDSETELRRDDYMAAHRTERFADEFLVCKGPVYLGRVEERDARIHRGADDGDAVLAAGWLSRTRS